MKIQDVRLITADQLADELLSLKKEQFNLRFQAATGQMEKTHRVGEIRKDIARIKTVMLPEDACRLCDRLPCQNEFSKGWSAPDKATRPSSSRSSAPSCTRS